MGLDVLSNAWTDSYDICIKGNLYDGVMRVMLIGYAFGLGNALLYDAVRER